MGITLLDIWFVHTIITRSRADDTDIVQTVFGLLFDTIDTIRGWYYYFSDTVRFIAGRISYFFVGPTHTFSEYNAIIDGDSNGDDGDYDDGFYRQLRHHNGPASGNSRI